MSAIGFYSNNNKRGAVTVTVTGDNTPYICGETEIAGVVVVVVRLFVC